ALASLAALAIRNARLEDHSFKDASTELYNQRYFTLRIDEEVKRHTRFGHPLSLVVLDVDHFKQLTDDHASPPRHDVLSELSSPPGTSRSPPVSAGTASRRSSPPRRRQAPSPPASASAA